MYIIPHTLIRFSEHNWNTNMMARNNDLFIRSTTLRHIVLRICHSIRFLGGWAMCVCVCDVMQQCERTNYGTKRVYAAAAPSVSV